MVRAGRLAIIATLITGVLFSFVVVYVKYGNPQFPLTHWFNELSYYVKNGFVLLVMAAVFLVNPSKRLVLATFLSSVAVTYLINELFEEMNYFVRSGWVIVLTFAIVAIPTVLKKRVADTVGRAALGFKPKGSSIRYRLAWVADLMPCHLPLTTAPSAPTLASQDLLRRMNLMEP